MQSLRWSQTDLNKLTQTPADQDYHIKVQVKAFEISKAIDIFSPPEFQRYQMESADFNTLEGDIMEGQIVQDQIPFQKPSIVGFYIWARAYDTLAFIAMRTEFKKRLTVEHKNPRTGITGLDYWDPSTGAYKFIQTRQFFIDKADDQVYEEAMKKFVFEHTSIEPPKPRFANETREYQTYIDSRSVSNAIDHAIKWPNPLNRFAYYKSLEQEDQTKYQRLKLEYTTGHQVANTSFPDVVDDAAYDTWIQTIVISGIDEDAQKRAILNAEYKPRFDLEYAGWHRYLDDHIAPALTNRYAFYKHLQQTDQAAFEEMKKSNSRKATENRVVQQICPLETGISLAVFQGARFLMGIKPTVQNTAIFAATHTVKQMIMQDGIANNDLQADNTSLFLSASTTGLNILQGAGLQWALFTGVDFYLNGQPDIYTLLKTFISTLSGQSILELRQLILDIKVRATHMHEKDPKAPSALEMTIAGVLLGNPLAPLPNWMTSALDDSTTVASDSIGALKWVGENLELVGVVAGSVLLLALIGFIYSEFKSTAPQIVIQSPR